MTYIYCTVKIIIIKAADIGSMKR